MPGSPNRRAVGRIGERTAAGSVRASCNHNGVGDFRRADRGDLIGHFVMAVSGGSLYRKSSSTARPGCAAIRSLKCRTGVGAFDDEGVATAERDVVSGGVLNGYFLGSYSARKLGLKTTGNAGGSHNLIVGHGDEHFEQLLSRMQSGLLVTELMGQGVNPVTGDYSRGAAGFWIENGAIAYPVEEITIAGNLREMYRGMLAIGNDVDRRGSKQTGSILIDKMTIAGA